MFEGKKIQNFTKIHPRIIDNGCTLRNVTYQKKKVECNDYFTRSWLSNRLSENTARVKWVKNNCIRSSFNRRISTRVTFARPKPRACPHQNVYDCWLTSEYKSHVDSRNGNDKGSIDERSWFMTNFIVAKFSSREGPALFINVLWNNHNSNNVQF